MVIDLSNWKFWREVCRLEVQKQKLEAAIADTKSVEVEKEEKVARTVPE
jgi:hypothetical protein